MTPWYGLFTLDDLVVFCPTCAFFTILSASAAITGRPVPLPKCCIVLDMLVKLSSCRIFGSSPTPLLQLQPLGGLLLYLHLRPLKVACVMILGITGVMVRYHQGLLAVSDVVS